MACLCTKHGLHTLNGLTKPPYCGNRLLWYYGRDIHRVLLKTNAHLAALSGTVISSQDTIERAKYMARWTHKSGRDNHHRKTVFTPSVYKLKNQSTYHIDHVTFSQKADKAVLRRRCAKGIFRAKAGEAAAAAIEGDKLGVERLDGLEEFRSWEPLRTGRLFVSWMLEAVLLYLAIRMMLW